MLKTSDLAIFLTLLSAIAASGAELLLPSTVLNRDGLVPVTFRTARQITGNGTLTLKWTDSLGRVVEDRTTPVVLTDEDQFTFPIDLRRAVAMRNELKAHFSISGRNLKGNDSREEDASVTFLARPPQSRWTDYEIIMWQQYPERLLPELQKLGITGGQFSGRNNTPPTAFVDRNMRWYAENIGTDFYSEYHRYRPDRIQHWSFLHAKELLKNDPSSKEAFKRHPSFSDPVWLNRIRERVIESAKRFSPYRPFFYSLGDETGIADLAAFWDFDFSDQSLVRMREWLQHRYGTLAALNKEWGSEFQDWNLVTPPTTHEAMQKPGDNFAAWADFKEWMDIAYSEALRTGREAIESVDPQAYVNVGGGQRPGWGGYDYARITKALTSIEPYDIGNNVEIIRSLNPAMPMVSTAFPTGPWEKQRVWRELFHGHRGLIIWDEKHAFVGEDGKPGARGAEAAPYYNEIRDGIGALIINSKPVTEPIAVHYSQASMRTEWMLVRRPEGDKWIERNARVERTDDEFLRLRESWCQLIEDQGMQYRFVSYDQLENNELLRGGYRVLVLPRSSSLSPAEVKAIREFVSQGGTVIADGMPGTFNEHSRRLSESPLADMFEASPSKPVTIKRVGAGKAVSLKAATLTYHTDRLLSKEAATHSLIGDLLRQDIRPLIGVADAAGKAVVGVESHVFQNGGMTIVTLLSNPLQRVDELGPPDFKSNQRFEHPVAVTVTLPSAAHVFDARSGKLLGQQTTVSVNVDPYEPTILVTSARPVEQLRLLAPASATRGSTLDMSVAVDGSPADTNVFHVDILDPSGVRSVQYSTNILAPSGRASMQVPFAVNDAAGQWTVRVRDVLTGQTQTKQVTVN